MSSKYGNWGRPTPVGELKYWVQTFGRECDPTSKSLTIKYYRFYKNAGGKSNLRKIITGKDIAIPNHLI